MIELDKLEATLKRLPGFEKLVSCDRLSAGTSRETYRLEVVIGGEARKLALRRTPGDGASAMNAGPGLEGEATLFAAARKAGVPGPEVLLILQPRDDLGTGFFMEWISGETLGGRIARGAEFAEVRKTLARQCGEILARLHSVDVKASGLDKLLETQTPEAFVRRTYENYRSQGTPQPMIDFAAKWLLANLPKSSRQTLVHSDYRNGNLIVDPAKGVVAVLDWELAHVGDPMRDLGWLVTRSWRFGVPDKAVGGFGDLDELVAGYESVSGEKVDRDAVKFWEVFGSFWWSVGCLGMGLSFRSGLEKSLERPVIGRRSSECQIDCVNLLIPGKAATPEAVERSLSGTDLPRTDELLSGVRDFLKGEAAQALTGRNQFLARVAANSIDIALRDLALGPGAVARETEQLAMLVGAGGSLSEMRQRLCVAIREGAVDMGSSDLHRYLRDSVFAQVMIDQPGYAGAVEAGKHS